MQGMELTHKASSTIFFSDCERKDWNMRSRQKEERKNIKYLPHQPPNPPDITLLLLQSTFYASVFSFILFLISYFFCYRALLACEERRSLTVLAITPS